MTCSFLPSSSSQPNIYHLPVSVIKISRFVFQTRNELREAMEKELQQFHRERDYFSQSILENEDHGLNSAMRDREESVTTHVSSTMPSQSAPSTPVESRTDFPTVNGSNSPPARLAAISEPPAAPGSPSRTQADRLIVQVRLA